MRRAQELDVEKLTSLGDQFKAAKQTHEINAGKDPSQGFTVSRTRIEASEVIQIGPPCAIRINP
jgi:hypothetical protein